MWGFRSSLGFPSNLGISIGILTEIVDQAGWCCMGSFVRIDKLGSSNVSKKGNGVLENGFKYKGNDIFRL